MVKKTKVYQILPKEFEVCFFIPKWETIGIKSNIVPK